MLESQELEEVMGPENGTSFGNRVFAGGIK
jgi:hypothetical protein